jgi:hypothetical protein
LLLVPAVAIACGGPAQAPTAPLPPVVIATTTPEAAPVPTPHEIAAELPPAEPPVVPLQRFAALVPGERADLYDVGSRLILRAGNRLFSLSPGQMRRERDLERALSDHGELRFGAIGGEYPDALVADQLIPARGENALPRRRYVRVRRGGVTEIARAPDDAWAGQASQASEMVSLPGGRIVAVLPFYSGEWTMWWLEFVGGAKGAIEETLEVPDRLSSASFMRNPDGSRTMAGLALDGTSAPLLTWAKGARQPTRTTVTLQDGERPEALLRTTLGKAVLRTEKALYVEAEGGWKREAIAEDLTQAWPLPDGGVLMVTTAGPVVRDAQGVTTRASWPSVTVEGRKVRARFASARSTPAVGFWAIAADGLGLFHDRAPGRLVDVAAPDAGASNGPRLE